MYLNNIYIKNYAEVKKYPGDIGVQPVETGVPELLSVDDKRLLGI